MKKAVRRAIALLCVIVCLCGNVCALAVDNSAPESAAIMRASGKFSTEVKAGKIATIATSFSLAAGETVTVNASYTPKTASVDFGLVDENGVFHFINVKTGSINKTIAVDYYGNYTFAIRNNASTDIAVTGTVKY